MTIRATPNHALQASIKESPSLYKRNHRFVAGALIYSVAANSKVAESAGHTIKPVIYPRARR